MNKLKDANYTSITEGNTLNVAQSISSKKWRKRKKQKRKKGKK